MKYPLVLLGLLLAFAVLLGIDPYDRKDWALENALVVLGIGFLIASYRRLPLSKISYTMIFVFLMIHEVGSHYTYAEVPYDAWVERWTGETISSRFGFERNHYDRLVHFSYGLLLAYPFREVFVRVADAVGFWGYFLPLDIVMSSSMLYELVEWGAASVVGGELGQAYLGTQGDVWDAHQDMALASLGAVVALLVAAIIHKALDRDFQKEWAESLRVKEPRPLGEESIRRQLNR
ncbi:MAG: putative membrane protein [Planctomycetota bacterium]|jgi:putative membrane protein